LAQPLRHRLSWHSHREPGGRRLPVKPGSASECLSSPDPGPSNYHSLNSAFWPRSAPAPHWGVTRLQPSIRPRCSDANTDPITPVFAGHAIQLGGFGRERPSSTNAIAKRRRTCAPSPATLAAPPRLRRRAVQTCDLDRPLIRCSFVGQRHRGIESNFEGFGTRIESRQAGW